MTIQTKPLDCLLRPGDHVEVRTDCDAPFAGMVGVVTATGCQGGHGAPFDHRRADLVRVALPLWGECHYLPTELILTHPSDEAVCP